MTEMGQSTQSLNEAQVSESDRLWSRIRASSCSLYKFPAEVRLILYQFVAPDDYLGKHPDFLSALRPDKTLYLEFLRHFQENSTYVLDEYKPHSFDIFCSMSETAITSIRKFKIIYLQFHDEDEMRGRSGTRWTLPGWRYDSDHLSKAVNVFELTFDISSMFIDMFDSSFILHIPHLPRLTKFNLVIRNQGKEGRDCLAHKTTDLDRLLMDLTEHFHGIMPKTSIVHASNCEDEQEKELDRILDKQPKDIRGCLIYLRRRDLWRFYINIQLILAHSRMKNLPKGGGFPDVTHLGTSQTWFWEAVKGQTLYGDAKSADATSMS